MVSTSSAVTQMRVRVPSSLLFMFYFSSAEKAAAAYGTADIWVIGKMMKGRESQRAAENPGGRVLLATHQR